MKEILKKHTFGPNNVSCVVWAHFVTAAAHPTFRVSLMSLNTIPLAQTTCLASCGPISLVAALFLLLFDK